MWWSSDWSTQTHTPNKKKSLIHICSLTKKLHKENYLKTWRAVKIFLVILYGGVGILFQTVWSTLFWQSLRQCWFFTAQAKPMTKVIFMTKHIQKDDLSPRTVFASVKWYHDVGWRNLEAERFLFLCFQIFKLVYMLDRWPHVSGWLWAPLV